MSSPESWPKVLQVPPHYPVDDKGDQLRDEDGKVVQVRKAEAARLIFEQAFPDRDLEASNWRGGIELDDVALFPIEASYDRRWAVRAPPLGGIELKVGTPWELKARYGRTMDPMRRVMVKKDGTIDLEAIRAKHKELVQKAKELLSRRDAKVRKSQDQEAQLTAARERLGLPKRSWQGPVQAYWSGQDGVRYKAELNELTEADAIAILELLKARKLYEVDEDVGVDPYV